MRDLLNVAGLALLGVLALFGAHWFERTSWTPVLIGAGATLLGLAVLWFRDAVKPWS